jgi:branched-chain amino acid transport system permease protein
VALMLIALPFVLARPVPPGCASPTFAVLFVLLSLGLNIVVGFAGLLDLGYVAFYAVGAYVYALLASPHFGLHLPFWVILPIGAAVACLAGVMLGAPTLRLRGDYLAIVTLGFGEIVRIFMNNLSRRSTSPTARRASTDRPFQHRAASISAATAGRPGLQRPDQVLLLSCCWCCWLVIVINRRLQDSRIGRAWVAIREDEVAAKAGGINTRNIKLLAFAMGASFGGIAGGMFAAMQGFVSPESFVLNESIMVLAMVVLGGMGNIWGVIARRLLLSFVPELLRYTVEPVQKALFGKMLVDPEVAAHAAVRPGAGADHALPPRRAVARRRGIARTAEKGMSERYSARSPRHRQALRRRAGAEGCLADHPPRRDLRPDRAERRRQDHAVQCPHRPLPARRGEFTFDGAPLRVESPHEVAAAGIARTFQNIRLFGNMTALENVMVGRHVRTRAGVFGAILRTRAERAEEAAIAARPRTAALRRHRRPRQRPGAPSVLRRPAPARDRAGAGHRAEAAGARRTGRRHERDRNRRLRELIEGCAGRTDGAADRARRQAGDGAVRPRRRARLRREDRRGCAGEVRARPER